MKKRNICYRLLTVLLSVAMCLQGGFVVPVFADGDFSYYLQYNEASNGKISEDHPIIIPDEDIDAEYGPQPHDNYQGTGGVVDGPIPDWSSKPYRIIGYTFDGWYTEADGGNREGPLPGRRHSDSGRTHSCFDSPGNGPSF